MDKMEEKQREGSETQATIKKIDEATTPRRRKMGVRKGIPAADLPDEEAKGEASPQRETAEEKKEPITDPKTPLVESIKAFEKLQETPANAKEALSKLGDSDDFAEGATAMAGKSIMYILVESNKVAGTWKQLSQMVTGKDRGIKSRRVVANKKAFRAVRSEGPQITVIPVMFKSTKRKNAAMKAFNKRREGDAIVAKRKQIIAERGDNVNDFDDPGHVDLF